MYTESHLLNYSVFSHFYFYIIGDFDYYYILFFLLTNDSSIDTTSSEHAISFFQSLQHCAMLFLALGLGAEKEKVVDNQ